MTAKRPIFSTAWWQAWVARQTLSRITTNTCQKPASSNRYLRKTKATLTAWTPAAWVWLWVQLGGGRKTATDTIDYSVGLSDICTLGQVVNKETPLAMIHARDEQSWQQAAAMVQASVNVSDKVPESMPEVYRRITPVDCAE